MSTKMYVGNLSFSVTEADLRELFAEFGEVKEAAVITDRETGRARGFAFVSMANRHEMEKAVENLNGRAFQGRNLNVREAEDRQKSGGGGYGGGGGGGGQRGGYGGGGGGGGGYGGGGGQRGGGDNRRSNW